MWMAYSAAPKPRPRLVAPPQEAGGETVLEKSAPHAARRAAGMDAEDISVLVVDDHPGVRSAIEALIARTPGLRVVGAVSSGAGAIEGVGQLRWALLDGAVERCFG